MTRKFNPGGIKIIGTDQYEDDVYEQLEAIEKNPAGKVLLKFIDANPKYVRIVPYTGGGCEASTGSDSIRDSAPKGVVPYLGRGAGAYWDDKGRMVPTTRDDKYDRSGTGDGSDVHVKYSPRIYRGSGCYGGVFGSQPDEILFHELVHAYRMMQGLYNPVPTKTADLWNYLNEEEWLAILIANIYIAAKNSLQNQLRADHEGHTKLEAPLNSSVGFLNNEDHRGLVQKYWMQEGALYQFLATVFAPYNPIYEFVTNITKYYKT
jgi:hypothetical protein